MANFICTNCNHTEQVLKYSMTFRNGDEVYKYPNKQEIICTKCKSLMKPEQKEIDWDKGVPSYGKIASMTAEQRGAAIGKRAKQHFNTKGKEEKHEKLKKYGLSDI